jgi:hypothetical protein
MMFRHHRAQVAANKRALPKGLFEVTIRLARSCGTRRAGRTGSLPRLRTGCSRPRRHRRAQLLFRFIAAAYERRALGIASHWPFESWGRFLPEHTTAVSLLDRLLHHANIVVTNGESYRMLQARTRQPGGANGS